MREDRDGAREGGRGPDDRRGAPGAADQPGAPDAAGQPAAPDAADQPGAPGAADRLRGYRAKRDFQATPEPPGAWRRDAQPTSPPRGRFVVQEHHARRLHWDLRLEHDGVLASWAVPNGIPLEPGEARLAVRTEDHPLEYLAFEGEIPAGRYGAGAVRIYDSGTFEADAWREDRLQVTLRGERLNGRWGLHVQGARGEWLIHRLDAPAPAGRQPMPARIPPMLAVPGGLPEDQERWSFEVKWDGVRAIAYVSPGRLRIESRGLRDITSAYPELAALPRQLGMREAVLDGEIVAFGPDGRPSLERLARRMHVTSPAVARRLAAQLPVVYAIFDLLHLDGRSLVQESYSRRREQLEELGLTGRAWRVTDARPGAGGAGRALLDATEQMGLEGVVAKRLDSRYEPGRRSGAWVKIKHLHRARLVIGGWVPSASGRARRIASLLVGEPVGPGWAAGGDSGRAPHLRYAGRVGSGLSAADLELLERRLSPLVASESPFEGTPSPPAGAVHVAPQLIAEVQFRGRTAAGLLRGASFRRLVDRSDGARDAGAGRARPAVPSRQLAGARAGVGGAGVVAAEGGGAEGGGAEGGGAEGGSAEGGVAERGAPPDPEGLFDEVRRLADGSLSVRLDGRSLRISNWEKVLYPRAGFTKGDVVAYYLRVADVLLAHLRDRPLTLKRYPDGVGRPHFYEKQSPAHRPPWVPTATIGGIDYTLAQDRATLAWLANLADIELHTSLSVAGAPRRPTMAVFDLDPGEGAGLVQCAEVALVLHGLFAGLGLETVVKASGLKGLQVYLPLNRRDVDYARTRELARTVARALERRSPELVVSNVRRGLRAGRVLIDHAQNDEHRTTVCAYSLRAGELPTVSAPLHWEEVRACVSSGDESTLRFSPAQVLERVRRDGDLFAPALHLSQALPLLGAAPG
ncbi:MAG TPA: DNA ligase D [Solirubrobacteraceae bacterium]|nr:DNA ligase D [Solirubrobacteraceae bacterium]